MTLPLAGLMCRLGPDDPFLGTAVRWIRASSKLAQTEVGLSCGKSDGAELHHQEQPITGIRGPSADAIGMTPAKAERVCIDSPLEGAGFETSIPLTKYVGLFAERCGQSTSAACRSPAKAGWWIKSSLSSVRSAFSTQPKSVAHRKSSRRWIRLASCWATAKTTVGLLVRIRLAPTASLRTRAGPHGGGGSTTAEVPDIFCGELDTPP